MAAQNEFVQLPLLASVETPVVVTSAPAAAAVVPAVVITPLTLQQHMHKHAQLVFLVVAIVTLIILFYITYPVREWFDNLNNNWNWLKSGNMTVMGIVLVGVVLLMAWSSAHAYQRASLRDQAAIALTFAVSLILLVVWFAVFYRRQSFNAATVLSWFVLIVGLIQGYYVWKVGRSAAWAMLPYLAWVVVALAFGYHIRAEN